MGQLNRYIAGLLVGAGLVGGCGEPPLSAVVDDGGNVANPTGVIEGTVTYLGPRPLCEFSKGKPTQLRGVGAVLILYGYDAPPPPNGPPPASALVVPMTEFFGSLADCMPEKPTLDDLSLLVTRTASFTWPNIAIGDGITPRSYRVEGVFDRDGDYYPLFVTHNIPTAGDVLGAATKSFGAVCSPADLSGCFEVKFDGECDHTVGDGDRLDGQIVKGVNVTLGLPIWTERPFFEPKQEGFLSSEQTIDTSQLDLPAFADDPEEARRLAYAELQRWGGLTLSLVDPEHASPDCAESKLPEGEVCTGNRLRKMGLDLDLLDPKAYSWNLWPYNTDGDKTADGAPNLECGFMAEDDPDTEVDEAAESVRDCHPMSFVFGPRRGTDADNFILSEPTQWTFPQIFLARIQSQEEKLAGIPPVGLLGGVDAYQQREHTVYEKDIKVAVLPSATMELIPDDASCDVDIYPAGNIAAPFEASRNPADCQELPAGDYQTVVLGGLAGALEYVKDPKSETGWNVGPGENPFPPLVAGPGQLWIHPNDLGDPAKLASGFEGDENSQLEAAAKFALASQSVAAAFKVRDPHPSTDPAQVRPFLKDSEQIVQGSEAADGQCRLRSDCSDAVLPGTDNNFQGTLKEIEYKKLPARCCTPHTIAMCEVPLCEPDAMDPGKRSPVKLEAWLAAGDVDPSELSEADLAKLEKTALTLEEAAAKQDAGKTVIFAGRYREAAADEKPDLIRARKNGEKVTGEISLYLTYDELKTPPREDTSGSPDCDALRADADKPAKEELGDTVRLKRVALIPSCVPFLMPAQCCNVEEPANLDDGDYGECVN